MLDFDFKNRERIIMKVKIVTFLRKFITSLLFELFTSELLMHIFLAKLRSKFDAIFYFSLMVIVMNLFFSF